MNTENLKASLFKEALIKLKNNYENLDINLKNKRDKKRYIIVKLKVRTLATEFGQLIFKRYIYKYYNQKTNKFVYISLLDEKWLRFKCWGNKKGTRLYN